MERIAIVLAFLAASACSGSPSGPSSVGSVTDISGAWKGTFASANNPSENITVDITQNGSSISGTWRGDVFAWTGNVSGAINAGTFNGQLTFSGVTADSTVCTGTATVSGSVSATSMSLTSTNGVLGPSCPAPLPTGVRIDLRR